MTQTTTRAGAVAPAAPASSTEALLICGVVAWPLHLAVGFTQAFTRGGFDLTRHPFSFLSLGDLDRFAFVLDSPQQAHLRHRQLSPPRPTGSPHEPAR
jgi:hypothetical protein